MDPLRVFVALAQRPGQRHALSGEQLCQVLGVAPTVTNLRKLREAVTALRQEGWPIGATPNIGYYYATSTEELEITCRLLRSRALKSLQMRSKLARLGMALLSGQLTLPMVGALPQIPEVEENKVWTEESQTDRVALVCDLSAETYAHLVQWLEDTDYTLAQVSEEAFSRFLGLDV